MKTRGKRSRNTRRDGGDRRQQHLSGAAPAASATRLSALARHPEIIVAGFALLCLALLGVQLIDLTGHDYALFLPRMLDSHIFYMKNGFGIQDYTASFCAGIFNFANPNSLSVSLPQALSYLFGPVAAIQWTLVVAAMFAGVGTYYCARFWGLGNMAACLAAIAVGFNGFMLVHILVGHPAYHGYGFAPAFAACLLYGADAVRQGRRLRAAVLGSLAALLLAAVIYGVGILLLHILATVMLVLLICGGFDRNWFKASLFYLACVVAGILLAAPKIEAALAMNEHIQRGFYPLPGFSFTGLPVVLLQGLFWFPVEETMNTHFRNQLFYLPWHEVYYGFTPVVLLAMVAGLILGWKKLSFRDFWRRRPVIAVLIAIMLLLPYAVNLYEPHWNQFLKSLPVIGQFSGMIRFFILYIPVLALFLGWIWNHWKNIPVAVPLALTAILAIVQFQAIKTNTKTALFYDPAPTLAAWSAGPENIPPVNDIAMRIEKQEDGSRVAVHTPHDDHAFIQGRSNARCYESLFGYRGERFPLAGLRPGEITASDAGGNLNMKNPACYVYPEENNCKPGDHFKLDQMEAMMALVNYGDPGLAVSTARRVADIASVMILLAIVAILVLQIVVWARRTKVS
ncbi:MAG: hypothetical protein ACR2P9_03705 [Gammaproteobacteria bacterium]